MGQLNTTPQIQRTELEELAHSLRNIAAVMKGSLRVLDEAEGDQELARSARATMRSQIDQLCRLAERAMLVKDPSRATPPGPSGPGVAGAGG